MTERQLKERKILKEKVSGLERLADTLRQSHDTLLAKYEVKLFILDQIADIFKPSPTLYEYGLSKRDSTPKHENLTAWVADMVSENEMMAKRLEDLEVGNTHLIRVLAKDPTLTIQAEGEVNIKLNDSMGG